MKLRSSLSKPKFHTNHSFQLYFRSKRQYSKLTLQSQQRKIGFFPLFSFQIAIWSVLLPITMVGTSYIQEKAKIRKKAGFWREFMPCQTLPQKILFKLRQFAQQKKTLPISGQCHQQVNPKFLRYLCLLRTRNAKKFSCH